MEKKRYFVIGFRKIHSAEEYKNKVLGHNHRIRKYIKNPHRNIDWNKTPNNIVLQGLKYKKADELIESANKKIKERNEKRKKKARRLKKEAAFAFEVIVDCTPDPSWTESDYVRYLEDALDYLKQRFDGQELVSAVIHKDEGKPHLHAVFSYFNEKEARWNQRGLRKSKATDLNALLDDFKKQVGRKYGLERGEGKELAAPILREAEKRARVVTVETTKDSPIPFLRKKEQKRVRVVPFKAIGEIATSLENERKKAVYEVRHLREELDKKKEEVRKLRERVDGLENKVKKLTPLEKALIAATKENAELEAKVAELKEMVAKWKEIAVEERTQRMCEDTQARIRQNRDFYKKGMLEAMEREYKEKKKAKEGRTWSR